MKGRYGVSGEEAPESEPEVFPDGDGVADGGCGEESAEGISCTSRNELRSSRARLRRKCCTARIRSKAMGDSDHHKVVPLDLLPRNAG